MVDAFRDGVWFVALAAVSSSDLVLPAIAETLDVRESSGRPLLLSVKDYLREKRLLLLMDNFEHVAAAAPLVAELLTSAAGLTVLITSREVLHLVGEREYVVPPLALPDLRHLPPL